MHSLHCILVETPDPKEFEFEVENEEAFEEAFIAECRQEALTATEGDFGSAFDWRADDAGSWIEDFPNRGVILGSADPGAFRKYLEDCKDQPLFAAKEIAESATRSDRRYRTPEELVADGAICLDRPLENGWCWSAVPLQTPMVGPELIQAIWDNSTYWWKLSYAISLANGDYRSESEFYSVPDKSAKIEQTTFRDAMEKPEKYALVFLDYHI